MDRWLPLFFLLFDSSLGYDPELLLLQENSLLLLLIIRQPRQYDFEDLLARLEDSGLESRIVEQRLPVEVERSARFDPVLDSFESTIYTVP